MNIGAIDNIFEVLFYRFGALLILDEVILLDEHLLIWILFDPLLKVLLEAVLFALKIDARSESVFLILAGQFKKRFMLVVFELLFERVNLEFAVVEHYSFLLADLSDVAQKFDVLLHEMQIFLF